VGLDLVLDLDLVLSNRLSSLGRGGVGVADLDLNCCLSMFLCVSSLLFPLLKKISPSLSTALGLNMVASLLFSLSSSDALVRIAGSETFIQIPPLPP